MKKLAIASLLLVIGLVSLSAYLRLDHSGIGCQDWPDCYGLIGAPPSAAATIGSTYERLAAEATQPLSWATPVHRLVASVLGLAILAMALWSWLRKRDRLISTALLGLTVFLAWLGIRSGGLHDPAIVMGNLVGGFAMLGLLGWMSFRDAEALADVPHALRYWIGVAIGVLVLQIVLGGLTSANFAASACQTLPDCHGSYLPGSELATAFDLGRTHEIGPGGLALGGAERADIHKLHRIGAVVTTAMVVTIAAIALRAGLGVTAAAVAVIALAEVAAGVAAIVTDIPIAIAVAHNGLAAMLLLLLIRLLALCNNRRAISE